jgi:two-component system osmolarity sensor histidine kinase EnvZ
LNFAAVVSASNPHQLLVWMVVLSVFMTLIAYIYLGNQLRPIKRLAAASAEYGRAACCYLPSGRRKRSPRSKRVLDMRKWIDKPKPASMMLSVSAMICARR